MPQKRNPSPLQRPEGIACPWCGARTNLSEVGFEGQVRHYALICERSPADHVIRVDTGCFSRDDGP